VTTPAANPHLDMAAADSCVSCGLCLPHCPTFLLTGNELYSPRGRLAAMVAATSGLATIDEEFDDALSTCLGCRACEAVCPGLVPYGELFEAAKANLTEQRPTSGRRFRALILGRLLGWRGVLRAMTRLASVSQRLGLGRVLPGAARRGLAGMRPLTERSSWAGAVLEPAGERRGTVALFVGCVMDPWFPDVHAATAAVLVRAGFRVVAPEAQTCCGALAAHDGHVAAATRLADRNAAALRDVDLVVSDAAGCSAHLKEYAAWTAGGEAVASRVRDVTELVASLIEEGALPTVESHRGRVAVQDPCHLRHAQRITAEPRAILRAAGHEVVEIDVDGICCGAAGVYSVLYPDTSEELGRRKASQVVASGAPVVASANPGCEMQLRAFLPSGIRIAHPVELYREAVEST
jgi:glycolate dehydrogenase iron-sulfur subunit